MSTPRPVLIDFFALSGTGKSTHSNALAEHLTAEGYKAEILSFTVRRKGKKGSFGKLQRPPSSIFLKAARMGWGFSRLSSAKSSITRPFRLMKWSYRLLVYDNMVRSHASEDLDFVILDPSLSSKLKKLYRYFDDSSFVEVISILEENKLTSDIVVVIEADLAMVKERRIARGSPESVKGDGATISVKKAFSEMEQRDTSIHFERVGYDSFSSLEGNIRQIADRCIEVRSQL